MYTKIERKISGVSVLLYHEIAPTPRPSANLDCFCSLSAFRDQMDFLKDNGISVISTQDLHEHTGKYKNEGKTSVALTFDDGDISFLRYVQPTLEEFGYPATIFVVAGLIGSRALWVKDMRNAISLMSTTQLKSLNECQIEIGSHSMTHQKLDKLERQHVIHELYNSKMLLEDTLCRQVNSFAYPHGCYNDNTVQLVAATGYRYAYTTNHRQYSTITANNLAIPRIYITNADDLSSFASKLGITI